MLKGTNKNISQKVQDIIPPGSLHMQRTRKEKGFCFGQYVAIFMIVAFVFLPAFPAFAQFKPEEYGIETEGSVALVGDEQTPSSSEIRHTIEDALTELPSSTPDVSVMSTIPLGDIQNNNNEIVSRSKPSVPVEEVIQKEGISPSVLATSTANTLTNESVDINKLREQIRREIEEEFRMKIATGEMREKIKDEITERIRQGCLEFEDGSYYCIKNNIQALPTSTESLVEAPTVFLGKSENGGNRGVFLKENGSVRQISQGVEDALFPALDLYGNSIIWQALLNNTWQIMVYDRTTASTTALTYANFNNMNPQIQKDVIVWQGWVDNNWEIFMAQREKEVSSSTPQTWWIKKLTENSWHDMFPRISGDRITWQAYKNGVWQVFMYDTETGIVSQLSAGNEKSENPRFVVMWEKRDASGGMQTYGYDMTSGESLLIGRHEDKMPFSKDIPQAPLQENKAVVSTSSTISVKNPNENNSNNGE
ncbi:MAG: hypothetical protein HZA36_01660 [Parcubacteria group bacterium]|nr:hypothetical protein [Parcubacteria group bacterium]